MQLVSMHSHTCWCNGEPCNMFSVVKKHTKTNHVLFFINVSVMYMFIATSIYFYLLPSV